ncbi:C-C motif chemokine 20 [Sorex araneus]|uniref:C-C motif chemokine 20 n=1 Tax=Sorex araneus TaxID=42254 RepID=UPI00243387F8|nr:C-C motif chemokine 20 [Sorex araneus]
MCSTKNLLLAALLSVLLLQFCSRSAAISSYDCCLGYTARRLNPKNLRGFVRQHSNEACDIDAVIFITKNKRAVCADPKKAWVKEAVRILSE